MRTTGFILWVYCSPLFHFDQLFAVFSAPGCSFLSCFHWAAAPERPYDPRESSIVLFWFFLLLVTYCSCILIQPMSVFLFFHSPRFFWFVLSETLLILCCLVPSFNYHIASPPMLSPSLSMNSVFITSTEMVPVFCSSPSKTFCSASPCKVYSCQLSSPDPLPPMSFLKQNHSDRSLMT